MFHLDWRDAMPGGVISDIYAVEVDAAMQPIGHAQLLCSRHLFGNESIRVADPCFYTENDTLYLFTVVGPRLRQNIGLTVAIGCER